LSISLHDSVIRDDPTRYFYKVQIIEEEKPATEAVVATKVERRESGRVKEMNGRDSETKSKWGGSLMEVQCHAMRFVSYHAKVFVGILIAHLAEIVSCSLNLYFAVSSANALIGTPRLLRPGW
jgi:hypothetical protein